MKTKGAETYGVALFLVHIMQKYNGFLDDYEPLLESGQRLTQIVGIITSSCVKLTITTRQELMSAWLRYLTLMRHFDSSHWVPKTHQMTHIIHSSDRHGNPQFSSCWLDESLNHDLKMVCRLCHAAVFERMAFCKFARVLIKFDRELRDLH